MIAALVLLAAAIGVFVYACIRLAIEQRRAERSNAETDAYLDRVRAFPWRIGDDR